MSFNLKTQKEAQVAPYQKNLRNNDVDPSADDDQPITEKVLPHREGDKFTTTEDQMGSKHKLAENSDAIVLEKVLNETSDKRNDGTWLSVPPVAALVEKLRQDRLANDYKTEKQSHWSISLNEQQQNGSLPKWSKNAPQHDKMVLNNDPDRFSGLSQLPTSTNQAVNDRARSNKGSVKPLVGDITTADVDKVVSCVKTGKAIEYDAAIVAILREADVEQRELSPVEQRTIADLKMARTKAMIKT